MTARSIYATKDTVIILFDQVTGLFVLGYWQLITISIQQSVVSQTPAATRCPHVVININRSQRVTFPSPSSPPGHITARLKRTLNKLPRDLDSADECLTLGTTSILLRCQLGCQ